jgi:hypothetical protein
MAIEKYSEAQFYTLNLGVEYSAETYPSTMKMTAVGSSETYFTLKMETAGYSETSSYLPGYTVPHLRRL